MRRLAAIACALCAVACSAAGDPMAADDCQELDTELPAVPAAGALVIGTGGSGDFRPIGEAGSMELVLGSQGGWMVTPTLEVDSAAMASDGLCLDLRVEVDLGAGVAPLFHVLLSELGEPGDRWYSDPLPVFLSYDLAAVERKTATVSATLRDDGAEATAEVVVLLRNDE